MMPRDKSLSTGVAVVRETDTGYRLLCVREYDSWDFPKAPVQGEADPLQVALDETRAATGLEGLALRWGEEYRETVPYDDGRVSRYYLAESADGDVMLRVPAGADADEDYEYRWVRFDEAEDVLPPRLAIVLDWVLARLANGPLSR
jgi:bis(5'-nucleosidyl)-tetraphosphatase